MTRTSRALRTASMLTALSGACVLLLSAASTPAKAAEERLHNERLATYALLPPASLGNSLSEGGDATSTSSMSTISLKMSVSPGMGPKAPDLEDPPLPGYDGDTPASAGARGIRR